MYPFYSTATESIQLQQTSCNVCKPAAERSATPVHMRSPIQLESVFLHPHDRLHTGRGERFKLHDMTDPPTIRKEQYN